MQLKGNSKFSVLFYNFSRDFVCESKTCGCRYGEKRPPLFSATPSAADMRPGDAPAWRDAVVSWIGNNAGWSCGVVPKPRKQQLVIPVSCTLVLTLIFLSKLRLHLLLTVKIIFLNFGSIFNCENIF